MRKDAGQTHLTKLIVAFRNFANTPKNGIPYTLWEDEGKSLLERLVTTATEKYVDLLNKTSEFSDI